MMTDFASPFVSWATESSMLLNRDRAFVKNHDAVRVEHFASTKK